MAEDTVEQVKQKPSRWAKLEAQAQKALDRNSRIIDSSHGTGVASETTLRDRSYVSGPQEGEEVPGIKVSQIRHRAQRKPRK